VIQLAHIAHHLRDAAALALLATPLLASAQTHQLSAYTRAHSTDFLHNQVDSDYKDLDFLDKPEARQLHTLQSAGHEGGGSAIANFEGSIGLLKAYASASYPYCCDSQGYTVAHGYADATAQGQFYDTIVVGGAGLATGTPVTYTLDFRIDGTLGSPSFEIGGFLAAYGIAEARLRDKDSGQIASLSWDASKQATGLYSLSLATQVGHTLTINGRLTVGAGVTSNAGTARSVFADFDQSAYFNLAPSVAGLNTTGASGHNFLAAVPEPSSWMLLGLGLLTVLGLQRFNRAGGRA